jgi:two-component system chemotaxis sensor kinase CheA
VDLDITRFKQAFFEEAAENAASIESSLLELEKGGADKECLNRIFRAAHSIKGGSGTFGLDALQRFTHGMESLLDRLREGEVETTPELVALLFRACDALCRLLQAARDGVEGDSATEPLLEELLAKAALAKSGSSLGLEPAASAPPSSGTDRGTPAEPAEKRYRIRFVPDRDVLRRGLDPVLLLRDLAALGEMRSCELEMRELPPLAQLDPEVCYLGWQLELATLSDEPAVRDIFSFVEDTSQIEIHRIDAAAELAPPVGDAVPQLSAAGAPAGAPTPPAATLPALTVATPGTPAPGVAAAPKAATLRVSVEKLDELVNLVGELVIAQSVISQALEEDRSIDSVARMREAVVEMERHTRELQARVLSVRMVPIGSVFNRFQRLVRDLGQQCNKRIELLLAGEDTEMDKGIIEQIADPLTHLIRNAIDHGLETPGERLEASKSEQGTLRLTASHQGGSVIIEVADDGRGIDWQRVRDKGVARGLLPAGAAVGEDQLRELLFAPGFSTAASVTDLSGRGVGMDVVRRNVDALSGALTLSSELGKGTRVRIKLPLTLAIVDGLFLRIGKRIFVLPLLTVIESFRPSREQLKTVLGSGEVVRVRGEPISLVRLYALLDLIPDQVDPCQALVVIVEAGGSKLGFLVDEIVGQAQVVVKSLETNYRKVDGIMGATILGDGQVGLILDAEAIARRSATEPMQSEPGLHRQRPPLAPGHVSGLEQGAQHGSA